LAARRVYVKYSYKDDFLAVEASKLPGGEYLPLRQVMAFVGARCYYYEMPQRLVVSKGANRSTIILGGDILYANKLLAKLPAESIIIHGGEVLVRMSLARQMLAGVLGISVKLEEENDLITIGAGKAYEAPRVKATPVATVVRTTKQPAPKPYKVRRLMIDAGHGGYDSGAVGPTKYYEKTATLDIAKRIKTILSKRKDLKVVMTRSKDEYVSLENRVKKAKKSKADLFVSIHCNASRSKYARGVETYIYSARASNSKAARSADRENKSANWMDFMLADLQHEAFKLRSNNLGIQVTRQVKKSLGLKDRKVEKGPFYVLARAGMPAVLVEVAFISNPKEEAKLRTSRFRQRVAEAICRAVLDYKKLVENTAVAKK